MTLLGITADGKKIVSVSASGSSSYSSTSGESVTVNELNRVDAVLFAHITGGYKVGSLSTSGNTVTIHVYYYDYDAAADGVAVEVADATDLSGQTITLVCIGT